ncbi:RNA polymerase-associated RTF1 -like protein [Brachionus plicatilis]|uniref:RNA polymerase-associated RTF1-like protein n=1 Tax=Brachionus plicatilis TaxID=10195 RepID=A0A3M7PY04_BRAPC|nr:RNA polymerase-associated RTF1 -like protein [Brachionus plicatilis]
MSNGVKRSKKSYGSDSEEEDTATKSRRYHTSDSEDSEPRRKKLAKKSKKKSSGSESEASRSEKSAQSDVEDGEVSGTEGSSSSESSVFNDGYDSDLIGDEEDRRRLDAMTEKEREEEIYRRTEQRDLLLRRFEMKKKIKQQQKEAKRAEKKKAKRENKPKKSAKMANDDEGGSESEEEDGLNVSDMSMSERRKVNESKRKETEVSKALASLKADREKKKQQAENQRVKMEKIQQQKKLRTEDVFSSSSNDEEDNDSRSERSDSQESDSSSDSDNRVQSKQARVPIGSKDDLSRIKLSRHKAEKWCHTPFFKKVAIGCYVRIGIGNNKGLPVYQIAEVVDVLETPKVYQLGTTRTNKGLKLRHGADERTYRLEFISNQPFSDDEFSRWKSAMEKKSLRLPTLSDVDTKCKEIQSFVEYSLKEEDLDFIQQEKKKFSKNDDKIVEKKLELLKKREEARQSNDMAQVEEIDLKIQELNQKADVLSAKRSGNFLMLSQINQRNRQRTSVAVEEAMKKEFERQKEVKDDPFQRRKELPSLIHIKKKPAQDNGEQKKEVIKKEDQSSKVASESKTNPESEKRKSAETNKTNDLFQAHNFDIAIDFSGSAFPPGQIQQSSLTSGNSVSSGSTVSRRALNLDDYKRKKGLI